jgi:integrase/recombinase XerC
MTTKTESLTIAKAIERFLRSLEAKNRAELTITTYGGDLSAFAQWLTENNFLATTVDQVERADITEYLAALGKQGISGTTRAKKLASIRELFRYLVAEEQLGKSAAEGVDTPKREKHHPVFLQQTEYAGMLYQASGHPRDVAILQVFLQTGIRVSELCGLRLADADLANRRLQVMGKGMVTREIELEKKVTQALRSWLKVRDDVDSDHLFLNRYGGPIGERAIQLLVAKYRQAAGITKKAGCHSLRHTFATHKAEHGVSPWRLREWLGHAHINTTQIYVHIGKQNARRQMEATSL